MVMPLETQINSILSLRQDPRDKNSPTLYSRETIDKTLKLIPNFKKYSQTNLKINLMGEYELFPGPLGGIDVKWSFLGGELCLEVPKEGRIEYEGHTKRGGYIHGEWRF